MAKAVFFLHFFLLMVFSHVKACYIAPSLDLNLPYRIPAGSTVTTVEVADCDIQSLQLSSSDPDFIIKENGALVTITTVYVKATGRTFSVVAQDGTGSRSEMEICLHQEIQQNENLLRRKKRRWSPPPFNIRENDNGPFPKEIEKIVSDSEIKYPVYYTLSGPGFNEAPVGVFSFDRKTGMLSINKAVDREEYPIFVLTTNVYNENTGVPTDLPLDIKVLVDDVNDNAPQFSSPLRFSVPEESKPGTVVGKVNATDRDQERTDHVAIRYSLLTGTDLFSIDPLTGVITTVSTALDREIQPKHMVTVQIKDMKGASNGLSSTGTATIMLSDINDNPPTFKQPSFTATVPENEIDKLILRIPVDDRDLVNTDNWFSKFVITKGNENGNFRVDTDPKTNEGLLYVAKPLDFEETPTVKLEVQAQNKAPLMGTSTQWLSAPVDVTVTNVDEGPEFIPPIKYMKVKENTPNGTVIGTYTAMDPETKSSAGIKYFKMSDPASWINIDRNTGEFKVANTIDRESSFVQNGVYNVTVKAMDESSKSSIATAVIQVEDENDNVPKGPSEELVLCEVEGQLGSVVLVAEDNDQSPFSEPFSFNMAPDSDDKWSVTRLNATAATLQQLKELHLGVHDVKVLVTDLQGSGTVQTVKVRICKCVNGKCPATKSSVTLGPMGWLALLLPLLLLLLLFLLLACLCAGNKHQKMSMDNIVDSGGVLLKSNTEALGEEVDLNSLLVGPTVTVDKGSVKGSVVNSGWIGNNSSSTIQDNGMYTGNMVTTTDMQQQYSKYEDQFGMQYNNGGGVGAHLLGQGNDGRFHSQQDYSLLRTWQTNGRYLEQKLYFMGDKDEGRYADDIVHAYGFEGVGSAAGSVGCCSDFADEGLDFLDTLGPKFKTLADVCAKR